MKHTAEQYKKMLDDYHYVTSMILNSIPKGWARRFKDYQPQLIVKHLLDICRGVLRPGRLDPNVEQIVASVKEQGDPWGFQFRPEISRTLELVYTTKLKYGQSLHEHVSTMIRLYERLRLLGDPLDNEKAIDSMIHSLNGHLDWQRLMLDCDDSFDELVKLLEIAHQTGAYREGKELSIFVIDINLHSSSDWVFDTGCGSHIVNHMQGFNISRKIEKGELDVRVENGARVAALAIGSYSLKLPSGLVLKLNNCYYVPSLTKNIISVSVLDTEGFSFEIKDKCCFISKNNMSYAHARLINGLYVLKDSVQIFNIDSKKQKSNDSNLTFL